MSSVENAIVSWERRKSSASRNAMSCWRNIASLPSRISSGDLRRELLGPLAHARPRTPRRGTTRLTIPMRSASARRDLLAEQQQLVGLLARDVAVDQRHDHEREHADVDLRACRSARPPGEDQVARERDPERAGEHVAVGGADRRLAELADRAETAAGTARSRSACAPAARPPRTRPGWPPAGEDPLVRGGQHHAADVGSSRAGLERRDQLVEQLVRERVARVGLVERDRRDPGRQTS